MVHGVGTLDDFPSGSITVRRIGDRSIGVVNAGGELYAVLNVCPHALAPVCEGRLTGTMMPSDAGEAVWGLQDRLLRCPWHGFEFDLADRGRTVFTTFKARVRMFPVTVTDGVVAIDVPDQPTPAPAGVGAGEDQPERAA